MTEDWLARWREGRIGWHEENGNRFLRKFWPDIASGRRVLVPLCGKSTDLVWLARNGHDVTGVELSEIAVRDFFAEAGLHFDTRVADDITWFIGQEARITLACGDFFRFFDGPFDALYDRGALVALPPETRPEYIRHLHTLLKPDAAKLLVTLEYDQARVSGPPFSILADEVLDYWDDLKCVVSRNDIDNSPPKFRKAGLTKVIESIWASCPA